MFGNNRNAGRRRAASTGRYVAYGVGAVLVLVLVSGLVLWRYANSRIDRTDIPTLEANRSEDEAAAEATPTEDTVPVPATLNVLVVGTDSREGLTDQQLEELGTEDIGTNLTDTIMLVQVSPARETAVILSFPRDLKVELPGTGATKINAVFGKGGPDLLVSTIQDYTGVSIDNYVEVNIAGFLKLTDAVGGVEVCLDAAMVDRYAGVDLPAGCQTLDGRQATGFVRSRRVKDQFGGDDDFGRIARQQYFIKQAMTEVTSARTLFNPLKVKALIDVVAGSVTTDRDLGAAEMFRLANALKSLGAEDVATRAIPGYYSAEDGFVHAYPDQAAALFQALQMAEPLPDVGTTVPEELTADKVVVRILNGNGQEGLAAEVQAFLTDREFQIADTGNADNFDFEVTEVAFASSEEPKANLVAQQFPGAKLVPLEEKPDGADVIVTIGKDWNGGA